MARNSFVMYTDYYEHLEDLTDDEVGQLTRHIFQYAMGNEVNIENRVVKMTFSFIRQQMDRDKEKYESTCQKRAEAGALGGRPKKANGLEEKPKKANGFSEKQKNPVNENDNENENDNDLRKEKVKRKLFQKPSLENVIGYCQEMGITNIDAQKFIDYYESNGWKVGKNPMKDWKATVRNWARQDYGKAEKANTKIHDYSEREYDFDNLLKDVVNK